MTDQAVEGEVGRARPRKGDARLITGQTNRTDNISVNGLLHLAIGRSPMAPARVDVSPVLERAGFIAAFRDSGLAEGLGAMSRAWPVTEDIVPPEHPAVAVDEVRCAGEAVAVVVHDRPATADALEAIETRRHATDPGDPRTVVPGRGLGDGGARGSRPGPAGRRPARGVAARVPGPRGQRGTACGAVVVMLSDGGKRGDPEWVGVRMRGPHRPAHRVIRAGPRKACPRYASPATRMAAALPSLDAFVEGHSPAPLERLAALVRGVGPASVEGADRA